MRTISKTIVIASIALLFTCGCRTTPPPEAWEYDVIDHAFAGNLKRDVNNAAKQGWEVIGFTGQHDSYTALVRRLRKR